MIRPNVTPDLLRALQCAYSRYVRLTELRGKNRLRAAEKSELWMLRQYLEEEFEMDLGEKRSDP